jgi:hypothetical protein
LFLQSLSQDNSAEKRVRPFVSGALEDELRSRKNVFVVKVTFVPAVIGAATLAACGGGGSPTAGGSMSQGSTTRAAMTEPAASTVAGEASCPAGLMTVSGQANIFGAGSDFAAAPGGGGGGVIPPSVQLPEDSTVVMFPTVKGKVTGRMGSLPYKGPGGDGKGETDIDSYGGISGIVDRQHGMFLVGVFLTDNPPSTSVPERLDFTKDERFQTLAPQVGQTFFIGDGRGRTFRVPSGATRLFLGFADAFSLGEVSSGGNYQGHPGTYDNNGGHLCVEIKAAEQ